jgi:hypothetical protein
MGTAHLCFFLIIETTGSHVPCVSLNQVHAVLMPDAIWPVNRFLPDLSQVKPQTLVLTSSLLFRHFFERFAFAHLLDSHLTKSSFAFSSTLTTKALYLCSLRWFEACSCKPGFEGPSLILHTAPYAFGIRFVTHGAQSDLQRNIGFLRSYLL